MVVFSNQALGPSVDLLVSADVASAVLAEVAAAAHPLAEARWEHELVTWLVTHAGGKLDGLDVGDIAWTPQYFDCQRAFLIAAIDRAMVSSDHARALGRWRQMIEAHPRHAVSVRRRWQWPSSEITT
jgi:hypothetical protein